MASSFILHSGLRIPELVNLNVDDIDLKKKFSYVYRKGKNDDSFKTPVYFRQEEVEDLQAYFTLRDVRYKAKREKALFLAIANGKNEGSRMTKRAYKRWFSNMQNGLANLICRYISLDIHSPQTIICVTIFTKRRSSWDMHRRKPRKIMLI